MLGQGANAVVLHRFSSGYSFINGKNLARSYSDAIAAIHREGGAVLYGDDLGDAGRWIIDHMKADTRPSALITGAWSDKDHGCVAAIADALEQAGADVTVSLHSPLSPDGSGARWTSSNRKPS